MSDLSVAMIQDGKRYMETDWLFSVEDDGKVDLQYFPGCSKVGVSMLHVLRRCGVVTYCNGERVYKVCEVDLGNDTVTRLEVGPDGRPLVDENREVVRTKLYGNVEFRLEA